MIAVVRGAMKKPIIIIFGKDPILRYNLKKRLENNGFTVNEAPEKCDVMALYNSIQPDLVLVCSYRKAPGDKLSVIRKLRKSGQRVPIILINRFSSESRAIAALRAGANDYFKVPFSSDKIIKRIFRLVSDRKFEISCSHKMDKARALNRQLMVGKSKCMSEIKNYLDKVAPTDSNVLITGETGTGKELAAGLIHLKSPRYKNPFVCINSAALPETLIESELFGYERGAFTGAVAEKPGKFELARGGTVFLDEIGDMNHFAQAKILRSIENREFYHLGGRKPLSFDARIVAATNKEPEQLIEERKLRDDLYYRLNVARINLPPLRKRKEDIPPLVTHAVKRLNNRFGRNILGLTDDAMASLLRYDWPGNIRELFNLLEALYINLPSRQINFIDLPRPIQKRIKSTQICQTDERKQIVSTLLETNWNKSTAAQKLKWSRMTLYRKMTKYNIVEKRSRDRKIL
jgi:two-component system response regulator HydG/two-component system response regulator AtoC